MSKKKENTVVTKDRAELFAIEYAKSLNVTSTMQVLLRGH